MKKPRINHKLNNIIRSLCRKYKIKITKEKTSSGNGLAYIEEKKITIPYITDRWNFFTALHEIGHVVNGWHKYMYLNEFYAEMWAIETGRKYNIFPTTRYLDNARGYILHHLSVAYSHGLKLERIPSDFRLWIRCDLDKWKEHRVKILWFRRKPTIVKRTLKNKLLAGMNYLS
jgi:hypothetical protein